MSAKASGDEQYMGTLPANLSCETHVHVVYPTLAMPSVCAIILDLCFAIGGVSVVRKVVLPSCSLLLMGVVICTSPLAAMDELAHIISVRVKATHPLSKSCAICLVSTHSAPRVSSLCKQACKLKAFYRARSKWFPSRERRRIKLKP